MAVTILERPEGHILDTTPVLIDIVDDGGYAKVGAGSHGLIDGDVVYITTDIDQYNGFFEILVVTANSFKIKRPGASDYVLYIQTITAGVDFGKYYSNDLTHGWSCVHLPITYRLSTDLYPTNSSDTTRNVSSVQNANGYTVILLSGSLGSGVNSYDFVKLTLPNDTELSGIYQILEFISPTVMIINLSYSSDNNFTSATALKHYNNYNILVRVYAGINSSHEWAAQKPYELAATKELIPDEDNQVFFSVNEIIKSYIETRNNLTLGTLPNNVDFWANFYIEVAESYDDSDGYVFGTYTGPYTSDQSTFEGTAVNAKLEFKNLYSGHLSEYLMTSTSAKFLTLFTIPVLFSCSDDAPDCYQDISFLNDNSIFQVTSLRQVYYSGGVAGDTVDVAIDDFDSGVYRVPLSETDCESDRVDISVIGTEVFENPTMDDNINGWTSEDGYDGGLTDYPWVYNAPQQGASNQIDMLDNVSVISNRISHVYHKAGDGARTFNYVVRWDDSGISLGGMDILNFVIEFYLNNVLVSGPSSIDDVAPSPNTNISGSYVSPSIDFDEIRLSWQPVPLTTGPFEAQLLFYIKEFSPVLQTGPISETKQFDIDCGCSNQEIRLTWLNNLGGFDYWAFTAKKDHIVEIQEAITTKKNILPSWPNSYGANADTIRKQTQRISNKAYTVRSQFLTEDEADAISYVKSSVLVQIINSRTDRRTVSVDTDSFVKFKDGDKTFEIAFNISFTDDIPSQTT